MIRVGSLVTRLYDDYLTHLKRDILNEKYPPENSICIVLSNPKEKNVKESYRYFTVKADIILKKVIDVMYDGVLFQDCELNAFEEIKKQNS